MTQQSASHPFDDILRPERVEEFLRRHPRFLLEHESLLESLDIPHPCGPAESLLIRQIQLLRDKNRRYQHQLNDMVNIARDNDALHRRVHQLMLALMDARNVEDAVASLEWILHDCFQADFVAVRLFQHRETASLNNLYVATDAPELEPFSALFGNREVQVGKLSTSEAHWLFGESAKDMQSSVTIPLQHGGLRGLLAIGSRDATRFHPGMGNLFLIQIGEIVAARFASLSDH